MQPTWRAAIRLTLATLWLTAAAWPQTLLGVYYGSQGWKMDQVRAMEQWQGKRHAVLDLFTNWYSTTKVMDNLFQLQLPAIWQNGNVPMITWEPFTSARTPADIEVGIANGQFDAYIDSWAGRLKAFLSGPDGAFGTGDDRPGVGAGSGNLVGTWLRPKQTSAVCAPRAIEAICLAPSRWYHPTPRRTYSAGKTVCCRCAIPPLRTVGEP